MIKLKKVILFIIFYNFFFVLHVTALNNSIVFKINNSIITQIDVEQELIYLKTLANGKAFPLLITDIHQVTFQFQYH